MVSGRIEGEEADHPWWLAVGLFSWLLRRSVKVLLPWKAAEMLSVCPLSFREKTPQNTFNCTLGILDWPFILPSSPLRLAEACGFSQPLLLLWIFSSFRLLHPCAHNESQEITGLCCRWAGIIGSCQQWPFLHSPFKVILLAWILTRLLALQTC